MCLLQNLTEIQPREETDLPRWFVLNFLARGPIRKGAAPADWISRFNQREKATLEAFCPTFVRYVERKGKMMPKDVPLAFHYVFVRGTFKEVKKFCALPNGFSFVLNTSSESRYAVVDDETMRNFRKICLTYSNKVPFYSLEGVNLEDWDLVEVVEGDFPGLVGYYAPSPGKGKGRIILRLTGNLGTVTCDINTSYIRILEFSRNSKRAYDIVDDFLPHLFAVMRKYHNEEQLNEVEISRLSSFCRRMGSCRIDNHKLEAKLLAILVMASHILGDINGEIEARERLDRRINSVTAPAMKALISLFGYLISRSPLLLTEGELHLGDIAEKKSSSLTLLRSEYTHYRSLLPN